jgi:methyl-accepting chemotaxis protein
VTGVGVDTRSVSPELAFKGSTWTDSSGSYICQAFDLPEGHTMYLLVNGFEISKKHLENLRLGETGYGYVLTESGLLLYHPNPEYIDRDDIINMDNPIYDMVFAPDESTGVFTYWFEGKEKWATYDREDSLGFAVVTTIDYNEVAAPMKRVNMVIYIASTVIALIIIILTNVLLLKMIFHPIAIINYSIMRMSHGHLYEEPGEYKNDHDEIALIWAMTNKLRNDLKDFFTKMHRNIGAINLSSQELSANIEETAAAINQIAGNISSSNKQIAAQTDAVIGASTANLQVSKSLIGLNSHIKNQSGSIEESSSAIEQMIANIEMISAAAVKMHGAMKQLSDYVAEGVDAQNTSQKIAQDVSKRTESLDSANSLIGDVAAQSNILGINAAIEAAHSGSSGKGFAVIAEQINNMANQTTEQSKAVSEDIKGIESQAHNMVNAMDKSSVLFKSISEAVESAGQVIDEVKDGMLEQSAGSKQIIEALSNMRDIAVAVLDSSQEMGVTMASSKKSMTAVSNIGQEVVQSANEIKYGIDEINKAVTQISELSVDNASKLGEIVEASAFFQIQEPSTK